MSDKGEAWIPFDVNDSGPNWGGRPTRRRVGMIARVLREEERGRVDDDGREGGRL